jgi:hypothetical protein
MTLVLWFILAISNGKDGELNGATKSGSVKHIWKCSQEINQYKVALVYGGNDARGC